MTQSMHNISLLFTFLIFECTYKSYFTVINMVMKLKVYLTKKMFHIRPSTICMSQLSFATPPK